MLDHGLQTKQVGQLTDAGEPRREQQPRAFRVICRNRLLDDVYLLLTNELVVGKVEPHQCANRAELHRDWTCAGVGVMDRYTSSTTFPRIAWTSQRWGKINGDPIRQRNIFDNS